jgi:hypothetical protein
VTYWHTNACTPVALGRLFREPFEAACRRIVNAGGNYQSVTPDVLQRVLEPHGIRQVQDFVKRPRKFSAWRRGKRGAWVTVVTGRGASTGHCVTLRDGRAMDNGWCSEGSYEGYDRFKTLRVHAAWQISKV